MFVLLITSLRNLSWQRDSDNGFVQQGADNCQVFPNHEQTVFIFNTINSVFHHCGSIDL